MTEFDGLPLLRSPVAIAAFEGWNDAADASTAAVEHLEQVWQARPISTIDPEDFYDFQVSRPTVVMSEGETRKIEWPTTRFTVATPPGSDRDVVLIRGIEPSMRWRSFCNEILGFAHELGVGDRQRRRFLKRRHIRVAGQRLFQQRRAGARDRKSVV